MLKLVAVCLALFLAISDGAQPGGGSCHDVCTDVYEPVCGSDGTTYNNMCELDLANCHHGSTVTVAHKGPCSHAGGN